ncbi:MAG: sulfite exporter TauE/SafE family protein [Dehalococcoidales bacterium]|nr:sulfite exporter TauE/SafE family protein [Dehalococcoidales bacterium]
MPVLQIVILLCTGIGIGFLSGLLGIGGGIVLTPVQYWIYSSSGISTDLAIKIACATSLAVVLPTAASGVWQYQKRNGIYWKAAVYMGIFTAAGSFIGATLAARIPGSAIKTGFGALAIIIALRMVTLKIYDTPQPVRESRWLWIAVALPIGVITGLMGIGGGVLAVPLLVLVLRFSIRNAAGTSLAMMLFTSTGGITGYILNGIGSTGLPGYTLGYIHWPAWIALSVTSIGMAQIGAITAHRLPGKWLNYILVGIISYVGLEMAGIIGWIASHFS